MLLRTRGNAVPFIAKHALECLIKFERDVFPTLCVSYNLLLTIGLSIASCERPFSKLKLIKTCTRSSMLQKRLTSLAFDQHRKRIPFSRCKKWGPVFPRVSRLMGARTHRDK